MIDNEHFQTNFNSFRGFFHFFRKIFIFGNNLLEILFHEKFFSRSFKVDIFELFHLCMIMIIRSFVIDDNFEFSDSYGAQKKKLHQY